MRAMDRVLGSGINTEECPLVGMVSQMACFYAMIL